MVAFQDRLSPRGQGLLDRLANLLDTFNHITVNMKSICNADGTRKAFADPRMIRLSQVHHNGFGLQQEKVGMLASIGTQVFELATSQ
ncbi:hypothetical protein D3C78_1490880 [compost metagenome]